MSQPDSKLVEWAKGVERATKVSQAARRARTPFSDRGPTPQRPDASGSGDSGIKIRGLGNASSESESARRELLHRAGPGKFGDWLKTLGMPKTAPTKFKVADYGTNPSANAREEYDDDPIGNLGTVRGCLHQINTSAEALSEALGDEDDEDREAAAQWLQSIMEAVATLTDYCSASPYTVATCQR